MNPALIAASVTAPGYLIELGFSPVRYFSTRGLQTWAAQTWVSGSWLYSDGKLTVPEGDPALTKLILSQGTVGRSVRVWIFCGATATDANTQLLFDGYADGATALTDSIELPLFDTAAAFMFAPRKRIRADTGFSQLPHAGMKIKWGNVTIRLNEDR